MQLEVGKYYKTRDGRKIGPMVDAKNGADDHWKSILPCEGYTYWHDNGSHWFYDERPSDLIAEWSDAQSPTLSGDTIDDIAIDSLKFHMDKDMEPLQKEAFRIVLRYYGVTL